MMVFVSFPKPECYYLKDTGLQRTYRDKFVKYLQMLSEAGCSVEILLEDRLAMDMTRAAGIKPKRISTCITKSDLNWINQYPEIEDLSDTVFSDYSIANKILYDADTKYQVPLTVLKEGKAEYFRKRSESYHKRYKYTINKYLTDATNVLQFRVNGPMDRGLAVTSTARTGDGRLCIEVGLTSGVVSSYYGGVFIQEETLPMILSL